MKVSVIIPTYWTSSDIIVQHQASDAVYDHPTLLESSSTLPRLLDSLKSVGIPRDSTTVIVIVAVTHKALEKKAEEKTGEILRRYKRHFDIRMVSASTLKQMDSASPRLAQLLSLYGYSNVRNVGLAIAQILGSNMLVFLDDDIIIDDPEYFRKAQENIGKSFDGSLLGGVAGYYTNEDGSYYLAVDSKSWWKTIWRKERKMNAAFKIIESAKRLTETTFAFGGNMVLHWKMFEKVPFDPNITRGEDMDLLVNARMLGFRFMLDTQLSVLHLPTEKSLWSEMRQDLYRFLYMRQKLQRQGDVKNISAVSIESLEPYPGYFLRWGMPFRFVVTNCLNSVHIIFRRDLKDFRGFVGNLLQIPPALRLSRKHCLNYFDYQKRWSALMPQIRGNEDLQIPLEG